MTLIIGVTVALFFIYDMKVKTAFIVYLVFPFGILPFTYVTSFLLQEDSAAQSYTMFFHFLTLGILSSVIITMRFTEDQALIGDVLNFALKAIPTYPLASSVYCDAQCKELAK